MRANILLTAFVGACSVSAAVMRLAADSMDYDWAVTGWDAGCASGECYYEFQISGARDLSSRPATPAFKANCSGAVEGAPYRLCDRLDSEHTDAIVVAKLLPQNTTANGTHQAIIQVSLRYTDLQSPTTWWNFTGHATSLYNHMAAQRLNFTITPNEIMGVA